MNDKTNNVLPSAVEGTKENSDYLRGGITGGLADDTTGAIADSDTKLIKFHGIYQQDNRDVRNERARRKLEPDYSFMVRLRIPGGLLTPAQWLAVDKAATTLTEAGSLRLTTRQTLQFHGTPKENLRPLLQQCKQQLLDSIAACGDVNRNVMCSSHAEISAAHRVAYEVAGQISEALLPATRAYYEIWLGEERLGGETVEPVYGKHYLPRKFKIGVCVPPVNDIDVFSQDIGFIAIIQRGQVCGFNVVAGGGLGMTSGDMRTAPLLGQMLGFCRVAQAVEVARQIAIWQRDYGDRSDRHLARLKYTIRRRGFAVFKRELEAALEFKFAAAAAFSFTHRNDRLGWNKRQDGAFDLCLHIENGRISGGLKEALHEIATAELCEFQITPNQNLILTGVKKRSAVDTILARHQALPAVGLSGLRQNAMACVALPTCPLAMAEAERYLPALLTKLEPVLNRLGLKKAPIIMRMTGCPNGCARPYLAEIGLVGRSPGRYNLYLGASYEGDRLAMLAGENMDEEKIITTLTSWFEAFVKDRRQEERFGDFVMRINNGAAISSFSPMRDTDPYLT